MTNNGDLPGAPHGLLMGEWTQDVPSVGQTFRFVAVGDIMLSGSAGRHANRMGHCRDLFDELTLVFRKADCVMANLETPLLVDWSCDKMFAGNAQWARDLREAQINVLHLASNHMLDFGPSGLEQTISAVQDAGITIIGAGQTADQASALVTRDFGDMRVGWLAAGYTRLDQPQSPRFCELDCEALISATERARDQVDLLLVSIHWGPMRVDYPYPEQYKTAHRLVDAGASAVIMHHAHILQGVEIYSGAPICYNLGNCIQDPTEGLLQQASNFKNAKLGEQLSSCVFSFTWKDGQFAQLQAAPFVLPDPETCDTSSFALSWADRAQAETILKRLKRISDDLTGDFFPTAEKQLWDNRRREILINLNLILKQGQLWRVGHILGRVRLAHVLSLIKRLFTRGL